jgi:hypothetical protein
MVMSDRPQALFQPRMHSQGATVEMVSVLEASLKKVVRKAG